MTFQPYLLTADEGPVTGKTDIVYIHDLIRTNKEP